MSKILFTPMLVNIWLRLFNSAIKVTVISLAALKIILNEEPGTKIAMMLKVVKLV